MFVDRLILQVCVNFYLFTSTVCCQQLIFFYAALDDIGHGIRIQNDLPRQKRASSQGSSSSLAGMGTLGPPMMTGTLRGHGGGGGSPLPPAPTSKPPTPPMARAISGSLSKGSREYRTPPAVAPPQVKKKNFVLVFHIRSKIN